MTVLPGLTSQSMIDAVRSKCLVPSARTVGASGWLPSPLVAAGKAAIESIIALSISAPSAVVMAAWSAALMSIDSALPADAAVAVSLMVRRVFMPASTCPAMLQYSVCSPGSRDDRSRMALPPAGMLGVIRSVSMTPRVWAAVPTLVTVIVLFGVTSADDSVILNSLRLAVMV